jgi:DNA-binding XRE family transcriptional regulator
MKRALALLTALLPAPLSVLHASGISMPTVPDNHDAHNYGERIREWLPRRLQELRERCGLSKHGLARENGISMEYIGKLELGAANPTLPVMAQLSHGMGMTFPPKNRCERNEWSYSSVPVPLSQKPSQP